MSGVDRSPTRVSGLVSVVAGLVAAAAVGAYSWFGLAAGAAGVLVLAAGLTRGRDATVTFGGLVLFGGVVGAGVEGTPGLVVLVAATATVLAWDAGRHAVSIGAQLGRDAPTARLELTHAAASGLVGVLTAGVGYGVFRSAATGQPLAALAFLLLAALLIGSALG